MPKDSKSLRIVVASPSDVQAERDLVPVVVDEVNAGVADERNLVLTVTRWERDSFPGFHKSGPQALIDSILRIPDCDIFLGIFWTRFGTPVTDAKSGTEHEYKQAWEAWRRKGTPEIFFYFKDEPYNPRTKEDLRQWELVLEFKENFPKEGLWWSYKEIEFRSLLRRHLETFLRKKFPPPPPGVSVSVSDLERKIHSYYGYVDGRHYDLAWTFFRDEINYDLDFIFNDNRKHLDLLLRLLPEGERDPRFAAITDKPGVLNALGRAYKNIGRPLEAVKLFKQQLEIQSNSVRALGNLANALRLTGQLLEADSIAHQMSDEAAELNQPIWEAYSLYWNGVLLAGRGFVDRGVLLLRQAQVRFKQIKDPKRHEGEAGVGRAYAHLAQIELWLGNPRLALGFAQHAERLVQVHHQQREGIFALRLIGTARMLLGDLKLGQQDLEKAMEKSADCRYFEEELAAATALAELHRRLAKRDPPESSLLEARRLLDDSLRTKADGYTLLLSDFENTLCQIQLDRGHKGKAAEAARRAYGLAQCDEPPFSYHWGLELARKHLLALGSPVTIMASSAVPPLHSDDSRFGPLLDPQDKVRADLRAKFTKLLRTVNGRYRYAPTKFMKMLREDWGAIRTIATGENTVKMPPQFIEIHLGEPCNLSCRYCRGGLRRVPDDKEGFLELATIRQLIEGVQEMMNDHGCHVFIRFSGLIGEPLSHPDIKKIFEAVNEKGISWGLTTNGICLDTVQTLLSKAKYVHVSVDAGTAETYRILKEKEDSHLSRFDKVIANVALLAEAKRSHQEGPEIIVSFLLQEQNYKELPILAKMVNDIHVDTLEIKMQHFDERRRLMSKQDVEDAYHLVDEIRRNLSDAGVQVVVVQDREEALVKIQDGIQRTPFERCYANLLGLNATVDPKGVLQTCCQYYQDTLKPADQLGPERSLKSAWWGDQRKRALDGDPRRECINCSPSDEFINRFVSFLVAANRSDPSFLGWVEEEALVQLT